MPPAAEKLPDKALALNLAIDKTPVPVIGAINGSGDRRRGDPVHDLRSAGRRPERLLPVPGREIRPGLDNWSIRRLTSLVGYGRARGMLLGGREAVRRNRAADRHGQPHRQRWPMPRSGRPSWPSFGLLALQHAKRVLNDDGAYEESWPAHKELFDKAGASKDVIEAQVARIEKRPPNFTGA